MNIKVRLLEEVNTMAQRNKENIELLRLMKLPVMAEEYEFQTKDTKYSDMSFDERLSILLNK